MPYQYLGPMDALPAPAILNQIEKEGARVVQILETAELDEQGVPTGRVIVWVLAHVQPGPPLVLVPGMGPMGGGHG